MTVTDRYQLLRARDDSKDQSYFLWGLTQEQLSRSEFPLGELTKEEVRQLARSVNLPVAEKPESMELCFVPNGNYVQFIHAYAREDWQTAAAIKKATSSPKTAPFSAATPACTITPSASAKAWASPPASRSTCWPSIPKNNRVIVGEDDALRATTLEMENVNWVSIGEPAAPLARTGKNPPQARTRRTQAVEALPGSSRAHYLRHSPTRHHSRPRRRSLRRRHSSGRRLDQRQSQ